jgi:hyperosmotically inducible periplasmic protein
MRLDEGLQGRRPPGRRCRRRRHPIIKGRFHVGGHSKWHYLLLSGLAGVAACDKGSANRSDQGSTAVQGAGGNSPAADNTKINERDRAASITPLAQGNDMADLETTQRIRKALVADDALSMDAKNVKVITQAGVVTLRGPVRSAEERKKVEAAALQFAGGNRVDDQLELEPNKN